ncbi:ATP synthase subunit [Syncephalis pseudoplumigaleata]|uniref:ATP synthase subunit n=1 Tax=Syncephalis pseudoplumigaleata TaxID=1712513 RepID=A0A4P9YX11_9FUNG|nr:ATP synthase subunit [Syncephalis pseudoplumigaleata]|eukprot:RKP24405.1 ATP synthase subunit [Syncephalis pseudoplumigaleata]
MSAPHPLNDAEVDAEMDKLADEEFNINKGKIVMQESLQIDANAQRKMKQAEVQKKIAQSTLTNKARLQILAERENLLGELFDTVREKLTRIPDEDETAYRALLKNLLLQSFFQLMEKEVNIVCREADVAIVEAAMNEAKQEYENTAKQTSLIIIILLMVAVHSAGGVIVSAMHGRIKCSNTLETRLDLASELMLPEIRGLLFGSSAVKQSAL